MDRTKLPPLTNYKVRDGQNLYYRHYACRNTKRVVVLLHGISEDSVYLQSLAAYIANQDMGQVITPDLRGYGEHPIRRGDLDYIGQLDDDLADLLDLLKTKFHQAEIILAGHSAGGGTALRFAASNYAGKIDRYLLLSPFVHFLAPIMKQDDNQVSTVDKKRLITGMFLNRLGYQKRNHLPVFKRNKPEELCHGSESLTLSYRLFISRLPDDYKQAIRKLPKNTLVIIGELDEEFDAHAFAPLFAKYSTIDVDVIPNVDHDGILSSEEAFQLITDWF